MRPLPLALTAALLALTPSAAFAQGADSCAMAQPIMGTGLFVFDNTAATTDGVPDPLCYAFGSSQVDNDVWFAWTAPSSASFKVETCNQTAVDTKIAAYDGGCGAPILACNDDTCGLQSSIEFPAASGSVYTLRIGTFPGAAGGSGNIDVSEILPPAILTTEVNPANGRTYHLLEPSTWTQAQLAAESLGGNLTTVNDQAENDWLWDTFHQFGGVDRDLWIGYNDANVEGVFEWVNGEPPGYENWDLGEPSDAPPGEDYATIRKNSASGEWNDLPNEPTGFHAGPNGVVEIDNVAQPFCFGDGSGTTCPCGNAGAGDEGCANSSGAGALVVASGSTSVGADDLAFAAIQLLPFQPGLLFSGDTVLNGGSGIPFGDGLRCVGQNVVRLGIVTPDPAGDASWGPGLAALGGWSAGDTKHFQVWYRDPIASPCGFLFNLSHGLTVMFQP